MSQGVASLLYVVAGVIGGTGVGLIVDAYRAQRRRPTRPDLEERFAALLPGIRRRSRVVTAPAGINLSDRTPSVDLQAGLSPSRPVKPRREPATCQLALSCVIAGPLSSLCRSSTGVAHRMRMMSAVR
jgi:hypothetical protein